MVIAPRRGMAACATLAMAVEALMIVVGFTALFRDVWRPEFLPLSTTGLLIWVPLVAGGAIARRRMIAFGFPALD